MKDIGKLGVWLTPDALSQKELVELATGVEKLNFDVLWYPEGIGYESFSFGSFLLSQTTKLKVASGIANIYARDAISSMAGHDSLNNLYEDRFILGLGVSHIPLVETFRGHSYLKPLTTMRNYLVSMEKSELNIPKTDRNIVLAALGPKMIQLAGEQTNGAHPYLTTPEHTARARNILGPDKWLCVEQKICLTTDASEARKAASEFLALYIPWPNYRNNWLSLGFEDSDFDNGGSNRFLDAMVCWGNENKIRSRLQDHFDAGASHVCVQPLQPNQTKNVDWKALEIVSNFDF